MLQRRTLIAAAGSLLATPQAMAAFPDRSLRVVVPFGAGANSDIQARLVAARMSIELGQPIVVENRAGGGGVVGAEAVARAKPDGYTLLAGSNGPLTINPTLQPRIAYDAAKDFMPLGLIARMPHALAVPVDAPWKTLTEFIAASREQRGEIGMGSPGTGSTAHFTQERLGLLANTRFAHVPYRSSNLAMTDLIAGAVPTVLCDFSSVLPLLRDGRVRALAISLAERSPVAPDVPTFIESGYPGFVAASFVGFVLPSGTPVAVVEPLSKAFVTALSDPAIRNQLEEQGGSAASAQEMHPDGFSAVIRDDAVQVHDIAHRTGLRLQ